MHARFAVCFKQTDWLIDRLKGMVNADALVIFVITVWLQAYV